MKPIRILLVDDQVLFRKALRTLLSAESEFEVVGDAENGEEGLRMARNTQPDVILMDLRMPVMDGVTATKRIKAALSKPQIIVLTTFDDDQAVYDGLKAGAIGYLLKDASTETLFNAIRSAASGEYFLTPAITAKVVAEFTRTPQKKLEPTAQLAEALTAREMEILNLLATGISNQEIAEHLVISEGTVKNHMSRILAKLGVKDRLQVVLKAKELGLIS